MSFFSFGKSSETDLSPAEFEAGMNQEGARVIDVRSDGEIAQGTLPNAEHIDFFDSNFKSNLEALPKENTYYVYCRSGMRSGKAVSHLTKLGYQAFNLKGGIMAWGRR